MQNLHDLETCIVIEDSVYDQFKAEVEALPKRRQKLWKFILLDKWGTKSRLAYKDGKLLNYSLLKHDFVEVIPRRSLPSRGVPYSRVGQAALDGANITTSVEDEMMNNYTGNHYRNNYVKLPKSSDGRLRG